eukprot:273303_1
MHALTAVLLCICSVIGEDYITFESINYTMLNATFKLSSSQQYSLPYQSIISEIYNESYHTINTSKCIQINSAQLDDTIIYQIQFTEPVEIFQFQLIFIPNNDLHEIENIFLQTYNANSKQMVTINGSFIIDNSSDNNYIHWETNIPISKTDIIVSNTMELHIPIHYENWYICDIIIFGNIIKEQTICLVGNTHMHSTHHNQQNVIQYFGTYKQTKYNYYITTEFKGAALDITHNIYTHILHDNKSTTLYLFKLRDIGWVLADNIPFINIDKPTNIYLTCFCTDCSITYCDINKWYLGYNNHDCLISSIRIEQQSCSKTLCMKNLTLITNNNQHIDISGNLIAKYNETNENNSAVYWLNENDNSLRWYLSNDDKWIYGTENYNLIICEPGYVEMPLFCTNWSYLTKYHSNWTFSFGNCDNINSFQYNNDIEKCLLMDNTPIFTKEPFNTDTLIIIIVCCASGCLIITMVMLFMLYYRYKDNFKYHLNQKDEIQDAITNNDITIVENIDDEDDDVCHDLIVNQNTEQQITNTNDDLHRLPINIHDEDDNEDMYSPIKSVITCTSPGSPEIKSSNQTDDTRIDTETNRTDGNDNFTLTIPYYRSDRTTVVSMSGQEGSDAVKVWFITKVNIPSSNDEYISLLLQNGYETLDIIKTITRNDLDEIGIVLRGHQAKLLLEIDKLKSNNL